MLRPRLIALVASLSLLPLGSVVSPGLAAAPVPASAAPSSAAERSKPTYDATIRITEHGIPHITADSFGSLGYGSGYAAASSADLHPGRHAGHRTRPAQPMVRPVRAL